MAMVDKHRCWGQRSETNRRIPFTKRPCLPRLCYLDDRRSLQFRSRVKIGIEQNVEGRKEGRKEKFLTLRIVVCFGIFTARSLWRSPSSIVVASLNAKRRFSLTPIIVLAEVIVTVALSLWLREYFLKFRSTKSKQARSAETGRLKYVCDNNSFCLHKSVLFQ